MKLFTHTVLWLLASALLCGCTFPQWDRGTSSKQPPTPVSFFAPQTGQVDFKPKALPINRPVQQTFEADPVLYAALSGDGRSMVFITETDGRSRVILRPLDPSHGKPPQAVSHLEGHITSPALSYHGRWLAFRGTAFDVKGDIYLLDLASENNRPVRLTGRSTGEGSPVFSPDGQTLYFHQWTPKDPQKRLMRLDIGTILSQPSSPNPPIPGPVPLPVAGDGSFPSISPDGNRMAFVSRRVGPGGGLFVLDLTTGAIRQATHGPARDFQPCWSRDARTLYFSRLVPPAPANEGKERAEAISVYRILANDSGGMPFPLTSSPHVAYQPMVTASHLYFLSDQKRVVNVWSLPLEGEIPRQKSGEEQMRLAQDLASRIPPDHAMTRLAYYKVLEAFPGHPVLQCEAAFELGRLYEEDARPDDAVTAYALASTYADAPIPEPMLASIRGCAIQAREAIKRAVTGPERQEALNKGIAELNDIETRKGDTGSERSQLQKKQIRARRMIEQAKLMVLMNDPSSLLKAMALLDRVMDMADVSGSKAAGAFHRMRRFAPEAMYLKGNLYERMGRTESTLTTYVNLLERFPDEEEWQDRAVTRILDIKVPASKKREQSEKIRSLRRLSRAYEHRLPKLAMAALNRVGDLYFAADQWQQAKSAYREVLTRFPVVDTQTAAARLALAEILYREERFRQALDLYETEMGARTYADDLYVLIRDAYINKSLDAADFHYSLGEVPSAQHDYINLIREDYALLRAHRGYIKCAAARKQIPEVLARYRARLKQTPSDPVTLYATGLCLTYTQGAGALKEARSLIEAAIKRDGQVAYFHQTLGYIDEVLETVYGKPGGLEKALRSYQKAYFLNNPQKDPKNSAALALNLGNIYFLLGNFSKALMYYDKRLAAAFPFDHAETEILFYRRLGASAFQLRDPAQTASAYLNALELIQKRIAPQKASEILGKLNTQIFDRIITPALSKPELAQTANSLGEKQAAIHQELFKATGAATGQIHSLPDPAWPAYRKAIEVIIEKERRLLSKLAPLLPKGEGIDSSKALLETLSYRLTRAGEALDLPESFLELKAEMLDRLALAFQEQGNWNAARENFEKAYTLNDALELVQNLAINKRSMAYAAYMAAGERTGEERRRMLETALKEFNSVIHLIDRYGIKDTTKGQEGREKPKAGGALMEISLDIALDKTAASKAMYGFTKDQEKRLAKTYISRIETELGKLAPAEAETASLLSVYIAHPVISDADVYGTSLLFHRAGHLNYALNEPVKAFSHFKRSAELSLRLNNPVSSALNVMNMAQVLTSIPKQTPQEEHFFSELRTLDKRATHLLTTRSEVLKTGIIPTYHNTMGARLLMSAHGSPNDAILSATKRMELLQVAGSHFSRGLEYFRSQGSKPSRKSLETLAALHLNVAQLAFDLQDRETAEKALQQALLTAQSGLLPEYEWRALAQMGRLKEAMTVLNSVPVTRVGCAPQEIIGLFRPLVLQLIEENRAEDAFNLMERISEIERVNRLSSFLPGELSKADRELLMRIYPRLIRIQQIATDYKKAENSQKTYLKERLQEEQQLLERELGKGRENLPSICRLTSSESLEDRIMTLLGAALFTEKAADEYVANPSSKPSASLKARYQGWLKTYESALADLKRASRKEKEPETGALFAPDPVELIDVMEALPAGITLIRFIAPEGRENTWRSLIITSKNITASQWHTGMKPEGDMGLRIVLWEDLDSLPSSIINPVGLSATHLLRCIRNKTPFKRRVLTLAFDTPLPPPFITISVPLSAEPSDFFATLEGINSLVLNTPAHLRTSVPTRPGERPHAFMALDLDQGRAFPLAQLEGRVSNVSLAILPEGAIGSVYPLAHLFSLMGIPTLLLPRDEENTASFVSPFFHAYGNNSVVDAVSAVTSSRAHSSQKGHDQRSKNTSWMQIGYWGMTPDEARLFAQKKFTRYVREGIGAFQKGKPGHALTDFENALIVAGEDRKLNKYVSKLHAYARESAFAAGRFQKARDHAGALVALLGKQNPDSEAYATALLKLGLVDARMDRYERAVPNLEKGIEILSHLELGEARISAINDLGVVLENATDYHQALDQFESAASLIKSMDKPRLMARQYLRIGRIYDLRLNRFAQAKQTYEKAYDIYKSLKDTRHMAQALLDMGRASRLLGNFQEAETHYQKALKLIERDKEKEKLTADILMEQANNAWFQADYQQAFELQNRVFEMAQAHDWPLERVMALNTSGLIWWTLGDHRRALRELERALDLAETLRIRKDEKATTLNNMALVYRDLGEFKKALAALKEALRIDTTLNSRWAMAYDLKNQAMTYLMMDDPAKAAPIFETALKMARDIGNQINVAKILMGYGEALEKQQRDEAAKSVYNEALALSRAMHLKETEWRALYGLGRLSLSKGNKEAARDLLTQSIEVIEGVRAEIRLDQLKDGFIRGKTSVYETLVSLLVDMGKPEEAFNVAERSRARNLIDLLGNQRLTLKGAVDQALYDEERQLKANIREYEALLAQSGNEAEQQTYKKGLDRVNDQYRGLMLRIQAEHPELASLVTVNPLTLKEIQHLIDPGVALLTYYVVPDRIFCWLITADAITLHATPLGRETLRQTILGYRRMLQNLEPVEKDSQAIYSWLLSRVRPQLTSIKTLGIIPHDALHHLSFATLSDGKDYLADRFALFYLPSASVLRYTREKRSPDKRVKVLAIGNPDLKNPALALPFAEHEVSSIHWSFPNTTVLTGDKATEGWVIRHIGDYGIVHMASHGEFDPINPLFSAIKLARDPEDDGDLEAKEIFGLRLNADLVVLSACQTGLGKVTAGDDVIGLNRAFLYAGTHAILSSLWRVSDISTAVLVKQFYREYTSKNKADGLKQAILHVKNRYPHPGYWGAFVLVGDYH